MKKLLSVVILAAVVMSFAVIGTSAAQIYMQDDFSGTDNNPEYWITEGTKFFIEDGTLMGYKDAVMHQSAYGNEDNGQPYGKNRDWTTFVAEMDARIIDSDNPGADQCIGMWVRAFADDTFDKEVSGQVYNLGYDHTHSAYIIGRDTLNAQDENAIVVIPTEQWQTGDSAPYHKIGVKVDASGMLSLWIDGVKVAEVNTADIAAVGPTEETIYTMGQHDSMVLIKNINNFIQLDNFTVASPDYYTENVPVDPTTPDNPDNPGTAGDPSNPSNPSNPGTPSNPSNPSNPGTPSNPSNPSTPNGGANATDTNRNQNNAASTGDALYVAVAIAVAALGCAVVVKKVNAK